MIPTSQKDNKEIKICGLYRVQDIQAVNAARPDYAGFIVDYPKSHRNVSVAWLKALRSMLSSDIKAVGVLVNKPVDFAADLLKSGAVDIIQLHGDEDNDYIDRLRELLDVPSVDTSVPDVPSVDTSVPDVPNVDTAAGRWRIWQAVQVRSEQDMDRADASHADMVLLDAGKGAGVTFDWSLLERSKRPFGLAGGLDIANIDSAMQTGAMLYDVSGGVETDKVKDPAKIEAFIHRIRT